MAFTFKRLSNPDLVLIEPKIYGDTRGFFAEIYRTSDFAAQGITKPFVQMNHSKSGRGVLRGLHYQKNPAAQAKLVRVLSGEVFDVAVDIRKGSPFYGRWEGTRLDAVRRQILYVPEGFAHGFLVLSDSAEVEYFCTALYSPEQERGIHYTDPALGIAWPGKDLLVSEKDARNSVLALADNNFIYEK